MVVTNNVHILAYTELILVGHINAQREPTFERRDARGLPASDNSIQYAVHSTTDFLAFTNWKFVNIAQNKSVGYVVGIHGFFSGQVVDVPKVFREVAGGIGPGSRTSHVIEELRERVGCQKRETLRHAVSVVEVQSIVASIAPWNQVFIDSAKFWVRPE